MVVIGHLRLTKKYLKDLSPRCNFLICLMCGILSLFRNKFNKGGVPNLPTNGFRIYFVC